MRTTSTTSRFFCLFFCFLFAISFQANAQTKSHFRVLENGTEVSNPPFLTALQSMDLDYLRYSDARRSIPVENTQWVVELYSGAELQLLYNKLISPLNSPENQAILPNQVFILSPSNDLKTKIID